LRALTESQLLGVIPLVVILEFSMLIVSLAQLVRTGALVYAKREFLNHKKYSAAQADSEGSSALPRSGSGVAGIADRIQAACQTLADAKLRITGKARCHLHLNRRAAHLGADFAFNS